MKGGDRLVEGQVIWWRPLKHLGADEVTKVRQVKGSDVFVDIVRRTFGDNLTEIRETKVRGTILTMQEALQKANRYDFLEKRNRRWQKSANAKKR